MDKDEPRQLEQGDQLPVIKGKAPEQVAQAIGLLAAGQSTRQIERTMGAGWSRSVVSAFQNKADVKQLVTLASRALMSRGLLQAVENLLCKISRHLLQHKTS